MRGNLNLIPWLRSRMSSAFPSSSLLFGGIPTYIVEDDELMMQDEAGKVDLTPLQGAHIVGDASAYGVLASNIVLDRTKTFEIEFQMRNSISDIDGCAR